MNLSSRRFATLALAAMLLVTSPAALHAPAHADPRDDAAAAQGTSGSESEAPDDGSPDIGAPGKDAPIKDAFDIVVEAAAPRFTDPDEGFYEIAEVEGVEYPLERDEVADWVLRPGLHRLDDAYSATCSPRWRAGNGRAAGSLTAPARST